MGTDKLLTYKRKAAKAKQRSRAIRAACVECMGGESHEVARCTSPGCPLFPFKMGRFSEEAHGEHKGALGIP